MNAREQVQRVSGNRWVKSMGEGLAWCQNGAEGYWGTAGNGCPFAKVRTTTHRLMIANHRTIPMDELSLREKERTITIRKRQDEIEVGISDGWTSFACFEFDEFYSVLERLLRPGIASPPSSDTREATAGSQEAGDGTPEVGDTVRTKDGMMQGIVTEVGTDGIVDLKTESGGRFYRNTDQLVIVKKFSHHE